MPSRKQLKIGSRIRLLSIPIHDLMQSKVEKARGADLAGETAQVLKEIIDLRKVVRISSVDEYGFPWFEVNLRRKNGRVEQHSIAIMDDYSWEVYRKPPRSKVTVNRRAVSQNLKEALEQVETLIGDISKGKIGEADLQLKLEYAIHHLFFAWNCRHSTLEKYRNMTYKDFNSWSKFSKEIKPYSLKPWKP